MKKFLVLALSLISVESHAITEDELLNYSVDDESTIENEYFNKVLPQNRFLLSDYPGQSNSYSKSNYVGLNDVGTFLVAQVGAGVLSAIAAGDPELAGWTYVIASPMAGAAPKSSVGLTGVIGLAALGAYNLNIDQDETSKEEIFITNMLGLNLLVFSLWFSDQVFYEYDTDFSIYPDSQGGWNFNVRYSF
ncbi:hypothetical protein L1D15_21345 [Vibrio sp. Isolate25]|uniref:hypothetical protein n=1 Tax=Vibrio sp. Isolate25 TaxID=2908535 RepID=UPI001EFC5D91|nr:hypothetical protein [Vibrio sp. Isolate25]MCG9599238.1 hypothetical protein [Vibrio sp. Isolate25]